METTETKIAVLAEKISTNKALIDAHSNGMDHLQVILTIFGLLTAFLIIYLGIKVEKSAIKEAADEAVRQLNASRVEIDDCVRQAKDASDKAKRVLLDLEGHKAVATTDVERIRDLRMAAEVPNPKKRVEND